MFQDRVLAAMLEILKTLLRAALTDDPHAKKAALAKSEKIVKGLKP